MLKFIVGALAGAAIGLLLAPKSGQDLREDLSDHMNDSIERGKATAREISKRARKLGDQAQDRLRDVADAAGV
jgi:gas vesicle protein